MTRRFLVGMMYSAPGGGFGFASELVDTDDGLPTDADLVGVKRVIRDKNGFGALHSIAILSVSEISAED